MPVSLTHCAGVCNDVLHVARAVNLIGGVCAFLGQLRESGDVKRETLAIYNVPVEHVDLITQISDNVADL